MAGRSRRHISRDTTPYRSSHCRAISSAHAASSASAPSTRGTRTSDQRPGQSRRLGALDVGTLPLRQPAQVRTALHDVSIAPMASKSAGSQRVGSACVRSRGETIGRHRTTRRSDSIVSFVTRPAPTSSRSASRSCRAVSVVRRERSRRRTTRRRSAARSSTRCACVARAASCRGRKPRAPGAASHETNRRQVRRFVGLRRRASADPHQLAGGDQARQRVGS